MAAGTLKRQAMKLAEKIDEREVFVADLVNDDLDRVDELSDEFSELERQKIDIAAQVSDCDDADERKTLRASIRALTHEQRALDTQMLGVYVEDKDGARFDDDALAKVPVRVQTALIKQATQKIYGGGEGPTSGASAT